MYLGLKRAIPGLRLVAACEIEAYADANLVAKMEAGLLDAVPIWTDARTFPGKLFRDRVDVFIASYPCQGFSVAGRRKGKNDPRHLWPAVRRAVRAMRPGWCWFENVEGHISLGLRRVVADLEEDGYTVEVGIFSAAEVGAPQIRKRVFILAHAKGGRSSGRGVSIRAPEEQPEIGGAGILPHSEGAREYQSERSLGEQRRWTRNSSQDVADTTLAGLESGRSTGIAPLEGEAFGSAAFSRTERRGDMDRWPAAPGEPQYGWEPPRIVQTQRGLGGGTHGTAANVDRLRLCGNGVVPAVTERAFIVLYEKILRRIHI